MNNQLYNEFWRRTFFSRLNRMTQLCESLGVDYQAGEFGLKVGDKTFPLSRVLDAEPYIRSLAKKGLDKWM